MSTTIGGVTYTQSGSIAIVTGYDGSTSNVVIQSQVNIGGSLYDVTTINNSVFENKTSLTSVSIPASITSFGISAFRNCTSLTSVILTDGLTIIGERAFRDCSALTNIVIPSSVTEVLGSCLYNCSSLTKVFFNQTVSIPSFSFPNGAIVNSSTPVAYYLNGVIGTSSLISVAGFTNAVAVSGIVTPSQIGSGYNITLTYTSNTFNWQSGTTHNLYDSNNNILSSYTSLGTPDNTFTFPNVTIVQNGVNNLYIPGIDYNIQVTVEVVCFKEDTKILCFKDNKEQYIPIQELRKGSLVKTLLHGYVAIDMIGKRQMNHIASKERIKDQLYVCSKKEYSEVFEDLVITGCHCLLVDAFKSEEEKTKAVEINKGLYMTDNKYRLPACVDEKTKVYNHIGSYTIYHFALENYDYYRNYGIFANGLLVETCSKRYLKELSNMELIEY